MSKLKYFDGTNWNEVGGKIAGDTLPIGAIVPFGGWDAPTGWLICNGALLNKTDYPELFNAIGYSFGGEEGGSTFGLPDLRGRVPVGEKDNDSDFDGMGVTGGEKTHTLTINEIPAHTHVIPSKQSAGDIGTDKANAGGTGSWATNNNTTSSVGGGQAHNILQPYQTVNYIIKAKQSAGLIANVSNTQSDSTTDTYSCDYINTNAIISQFSNVEDGYVKFPNGLMIQWGVESVSRTETQQQEVAINFPQSFNIAFTAVASISDPGYGYGALNEAVGVVQLSSASFSCLFKCINTPAAHNLAVRWIAIGKWK